MSDQPGLWDEPAPPSDEEPDLAVQAKGTEPTDTYLAFQALKRRWSVNSGLGLEVLRAMHEVINRYDVADRANRFLVGHYMEAVLAATFYSAGLVTPPAGSNADGFDLQGLTSHFTGKMSVKSSFTAGQSGFRISNGMGGPGRGWTDPTLFVSPDLPGIVYASPHEHPKLAQQVRAVSDATVLGMAVLKIHAREHPDCVIEMRVPANPRTGRSTLGADVFRQIVGDSPTMYPELSRVMVKARVAREGGDVMEQIDQIITWEHEGRISVQQRQNIIDRLLGR